MKSEHHARSNKGPVNAQNNARGRQFLIYGRALLTDAQPNPKICVAKVFAKNAAFAKSHFWKLNLRDHKLKKSKGEILRIQEIHEKSHLAAKNFGIFLKYKSRTGIHNIFKEFRDVTLNGAVSQMYNEMGGNYRIDNEKVQIINTVELSKDKLKLRNPRCLQWENTEKLAFPIWRKTIRKTHDKYRTNFAARRPTVLKTGKSA